MKNAQHISGLTLVLSSQGAAWVDDWREETGRILKDVATSIQCRFWKPGETVVLRDSNGNPIGQLTLRK